MKKKTKVTGSYEVYHFAVRENVPFVLKEGEQVLGASYDAPYVYLIIMKKLEAGNNE